MQPSFRPDLKTAIGHDPQTCRPLPADPRLIEFINLNLAALGEPIYGDPGDYPTLMLGQALVAHYQAKEQLHDALRPPVDRRVEAFLHAYLAGIEGAADLRLPGRTFNLGQHGLARLLSLPAGGDCFRSPIIESWRVANGVLHNPVNDRRTTKGVFHVCADGLPVPADKKAVPRLTFLALLEHALNPPRELLRLPFTADQERQAHLWVSLLLRPVVCPEAPGCITEKRMETRFFAPGSLVCNLDFVESIFGNAGDPYLRENDAGLDVEGWSGHTGCVILAPHLTALTKRQLGLPHVDQADARQRRDGMCWTDPDERYNDGSAFKVTARDTRGVIVTLIADNYFGYCKKEVKTQISYAANLLGYAEEEHAGGTLAFTSYDLGEDFRLAEFMSEDGYAFADVVRRLGTRLDLRPEGHGVDRLYPDICYIPEGARFSLAEQAISWRNGAGEARIKLLADHVYILPSGYKVTLCKPAEGRRWRLVGTVAGATSCHKPCTVSGGGKSEISKSIADAIIHAPFYVGDIRADFAAAAAVLARDYTGRFLDPARNGPRSRPILSGERSLGSVIKLLTPDARYTAAHNTYIRSIPARIKDLVLLVKRYYKADWGDDWSARFGVDIINGVPGHELKYRDAKIVSSYLRVGFAADGSWRVFSLRKDFFPADKIQTEDDITASVTAPAATAAGAAAAPVKFVYNCEYRLFQRPDEAIIRGYDRKTEQDMAAPGNFFSNYQALSRAEVRDMIEDAVRFDYFSEPMKRLLRDFIDNPDRHPAYVVCSANPRLVDGKPSKNPRYLQTRSDLEQPRARYIAETGARLQRRLDAGAPVLFPVDAVLPGRRNNPPEPGVRSLAVFNPIHYLPLPEAFMEFISSMTGKSPSTTGAGSEGALTKGPFNALPPITDLNNALVSFMLTGAHPFITAAGWVGPKFRVDHDISLLAPEIWCRMKPGEREPDWLIANGYLEPLPPLRHNDRELPTHLLGYRINQAFVNHFLGRIFTSPEMLFSEAMLRPEQQDLEVFADGMDNIVTTHRKVARLYFEDGSIGQACPPLRALLHIMAEGAWEGRNLRDPQVRALFDSRRLPACAWYQERLRAQQREDCGRWRRHLAYLESCTRDFPGLEPRRQHAAAALAACSDPAYPERLRGTIGRDPMGAPPG